MVAVFGALSLNNANPALADHIDADLNSVAVAATIEGAVVTDTTTARAGGEAAQYLLTIGFADEYTPDGTDSIVITMADFGLPESLPAGSVLMWIPDGTDNTIAKASTLLVRPDSSDMIVNAEAGTVTIPLLSFIDDLRSSVNPEVGADEVVNVRFNEDAGITTPDLTTPDAAFETDADTRPSVWEVDGVSSDPFLTVEVPYQKPPERIIGEHDTIKVVPSSSDPGDNAQYTITFMADGDLLPGTGDIDIKMEDFDVPASISTSRIAMRVARWLPAREAAPVDGDTPAVTAREARVLHC